MADGFHVVRDGLFEDKNFFAPEYICFKHAVGLDDWFLQ